MWYSKQEAMGFHTFLAYNNVIPNTLVSYLGEFLLEAERLYLGRDQSYTILGVIYMPGDPHVTTYGNNHLVVQLGENAINDYDESLFQLSHEVVHLLAPSLGPANMLEEGLATAFSYHIMKSQKISKVTASPRYLEAFKRVDELLRHDAKSIVKLRQAGRPRFLDMDRDYIKAHTKCTDTMATGLAEMF